MGTYGTPPTPLKCSSCGATDRDIRPYGPHDTWICQQCYAFDIPISPYSSEKMKKGGSN